MLSYKCMTYNSSNFGTSWMKYFTRLVSKFPKFSIAGWSTKDVHGGNMHRRKKRYHMSLVGWDLEETVAKCNRGEVALSLPRENKNGFDMVTSYVHKPKMDGPPSDHLIL